MVRRKGKGRQGRPWTPAEDDLVRNKEFPDPELARTLGRPYTAIRRRRARLNEDNQKGSPRRGKRWTKDEIAQITAPDHPPASKLAHMLGRSETAINLKRGLLRQKGKG